MGKRLERNTEVRFWTTLSEIHRNLWSCSGLFRMKLCSSQLFTCLNISIFKEAFYFVSRMPVNENRTTKAKHIYYQMSPVDHCYRENISRRYSRGKVRNSFFSILWNSSSQSKDVCISDLTTCKYIGKMLFSSVAQSCPTLCDLMDRSTPGLPVHHQLPEFTKTHVHWVGDVIQPSHLLSSPSPPALNLSQHQGLLKWVSSSHQVAKVLEFQLQKSVLPVNTQDWSPLGWIGWISLQSKGLSRVFSNTTVQKHQFFSAQLSL